MKRKIINIVRFSEIRKDKWQASIGCLSKQEITWLKLRVLIYFFYRTIKIISLSPVLIFRFLLNIFRILEEFEKLHFGPLRKIHRGMDCVIDKQTWLVNGHNIMMGDFVKVSAFSSVIAGHNSTIKIGTNTIIGPGVVIVSFNHGTILNGGPIRYQEWKDLAEDSIVIGEDVWIGANVVVLPGTKIGNCSVVGAGSIVKGIIPPQSLIYLSNGQMKTTPRK